MKSPMFRSQYAYGLNLSAVYETTKARNTKNDLQGNNVQYKYKLPSNKHHAENKESYGKEFGLLRNTIGAPEGVTGYTNNKEMDVRVRNNSESGIKGLRWEYTNTLGDRDEGNNEYRRSNNSSNSMKEGRAKEANRTFESTGIIYNKIMQKVDKKQKLIEQLKKLSQVKILTNAKHSSTRKIQHKDNYSLTQQPYQQTKPNSISEQKADHYMATQKDKLSQSYAGKLDSNISFYLNNTLPVQTKQKDDNLRHLRQKILNKITDYKYPDYKNTLKNPEEEVKKSKPAYYTPKVNKDQPSLQTRYTPKTSTIKQTSNFSYLTLSDVKISDKSVFFSPVSLKAQHQSIRDGKTMKQVKDKSSSYNNSFNTSKVRKLSIKDFVFGKSLGQGKFGTVYQALHRQTNCMVALKKISKQVIKSNRMVDQFLLQVKIQSYCDHQNILKLYGCFDDQQYIYLILQYMEEGTLFHQLKKSKTFSEQKAAQKLRQVAQAIKYLHERGIAHRDIKPQNIVISHGTGKLCDFGWAAICTQRRKTYCGTFDYAAPQILQGIQYDMSVDLWCLGVLAYQLMVGKAPFYHISRKETIRKIINVEQAAIEFPITMSKGAISFIERLIRKKPEERMNGDNILKHPFLLIVK